MLIFSNKLDIKNLWVFKYPTNILSNHTKKSYLEKPIVAHPLLTLHLSYLIYNILKDRIFYYFFFIIKKKKKS